MQHVAVLLHINIILIGLSPISANFTHLYINNSHCAYIFLNVQDTNFSLRTNLSIAESLSQHKHFLNFPHISLFCRQSHRNATKQSRLVKDHYQFYKLISAFAFYWNSLHDYLSKIAEELQDLEHLLGTGSIADIFVRSNYLFREPESK